VKGQSAVPKTTEEVLPEVGQGFDFGEIEKASGAFDGVEGAENVGQGGRGPGVFLKGQQLIDDFVEVFMAFDEEFLDEFRVVVRRFAHRESPRMCRRSFNQV
jgi:hypothetical protein